MLQTIIDTTGKYTAATANIEAGLVISLSNVHFSQVGYEFFFFMKGDGRMVTFIL